MWDLLSVNLRAIDECSLQRFSNNRVERLQKHVEVVRTREEASHNQLEALNGMFLMCGLVHEIREGGATCYGVIQCSLGMTRPHRKWYFSQVELPREYLPADDLDDFLAHWPQLIDLRLILTSNPSIRIRKRCTVIILPHRFPTITKGLLERQLWVQFVGSEQVVLILELWAVAVLLLVCSCCGGQDWGLLGGRGMDFFGVVHYIMNRIMIIQGFESVWIYSL